MSETRVDRTGYLGLLALMNAAADSQGWSYPYWNIRMLDAFLNALAQGPRDGSALAAPAAAPVTGVVDSGGSLAGGLSLEVAQTFVDVYGRETAAGPLASVTTGDALADPLVAPFLSDPTNAGSGYEGGLLQTWFTWTDSSGGETLPSPEADLDLPYLAAGLYTQVTFTLPSTPAAAGAVGANVYACHRGGNTVLAKRLISSSIDRCTLDGNVSDCYRSLPQSNSTNGNKAVQITAGADYGEAVAYTRFYVRPAGQDWTAGDRRLKVGGVDQWAPDSVPYPVTYGGLLTDLAPGFPPLVSQVKSFRPINLSTETVGNVTGEQLPPEAVTQIELAKTTGEGVISGLLVAAHAAPDMGVRVAGGEAIQAGGRRLIDQIDLVIPCADPDDPRVDLIVVDAAGVVQGPTENPALAGAPTNTPTPPSAPSGALVLAQVLVPAQTSTIVSGDLTDERLIIPTIVAARAELEDATADVAEDLAAHAGDAALHASKAHTNTEVDASCDGNATADFTITMPGPALMTRVSLEVTSGGAIDYKLELYSNAGRTMLEYQAGGDPGSGISEAEFDDRLPWEWFGSTTIYGRITNNSAAALTAIGVNTRYRL